jgi:hypothetical protein
MTRTEIIEQLMNHPNTKNGKSLIKVTVKKGTRS